MLWHTEQSVGNPAATGLVEGLARPGGNVTGQAGFGPDLAAKRLQLLTEAVPGIGRVAVLRDPNPANAFEWREIQTAGEALGHPGQESGDYRRWEGCGNLQADLVSDDEKMIRLLIG